ncbi:MAG TPA: thioredoxin domain-containing protein [Acidobacteriota bacterium]|nr:thioredoxin domain-containing protein [Acidobacteriota bacterium]
MRIPWLRGLIVKGALPAFVLIFSAYGAGTIQEVQERQEDPDETAQRIPNRLIHESSPYLRQHAYNPVDWYPWGEEAFEKAAREEKPVFLSVGYSTCHWCHVMRRQSFSDVEIAAFLNRHFVAVKVDREERPDVDKVYMTFLQSATGSGGWPMSIFLTPQGRPFFGGTYYPPEDRPGMPAFSRVLERVREEWAENRQTIVRSAQRISESLRRATRLEADSEWALQADMLEQAFRHYRSSFDEEHGGFGGAPKFPRPSDFAFLMRYHLRRPQSKALSMVSRTLAAMAQGGVQDHLGGGFHRYSTDARWFLPHFEKMLYDQAQLARYYLDASQAGGQPHLAGTARRILDYVLRQMSSPEGGFYSAEDADSPLPGNPEQEAEGAFYMWTLEEVEEVLGADEAELFARAYGLERQGNVKADPHGEFGSKNVLYRAVDSKQLARSSALAPSQVEERLAESRRKLLQRRGQRPRPHRDEKILTSWNGLMISALARAHQVLGEERYLQAARRAADLIDAKLCDPSSGRLKRRYLDGDADIEGMLEDYVFLVQGLLDLYEAELDGERLLRALQLTEVQIERFYDARQGGFFNAADHDSRLLFRVKEEYDGALPSPNSTAVSNLLRLYQMTGRKDLEEKALETVRTFHSMLTRAPQAMPRMLASIDFHLSPVRQVVIAGKRDDPLVRSMLRLVHKDFHPNQIVFLADGGQAHTAFSKTQEGLQGKKPLDGRATAYVCRDYLCKRPVSDLEQLEKLLEEGFPSGQEPEPPQSQGEVGSSTEGSAP